MHRFFRRLMLYSVVPAILAVVVFLRPVDKQYAYSFINKAGCENRSVWIYHSIFKDSSPIDVAFIGTSHSMNGIADSIVESEFNLHASQNFHFKNLAFCDFGRNLDFVIVRDLILQKKPKMIFLEIRESEAQVGHQQFAFLADGIDVITAPLWFNRSWFPDVYKAIKMRLQYYRECITGEGAERATSNSKHRYGFNPSFGNSRIEDLNKERERADYKRKNQFILDSQLNYAPLAYVKKISELCRQHEVKLYLIYLPQFGYEDFEDWSKPDYQNLSSGVFMPSKSILLNAANWFDAGHFNIEGSTAVSLELSNFILKEQDNYQRLPK